MDSSPSPPSSPTEEEKRKNISEGLIPEPSPNNLLPFWVWLFFIAATTAIIWGGFHWFQSMQLARKEREPFFDVTYRDFSTFLWDFPNYLRDHPIPSLEEIESPVINAPQDLLFLYHTWNRLLFSYYIPRSIPKQEFREFLIQQPEWMPQYWNDASEDYIYLVHNLDSNSTENLNLLPESSLPVIVRQAFQGWKNYTKERFLIEQFTTTFGALRRFIKKYPFYARPYWRNIQIIDKQRVVNSNYLMNLDSEQNENRIFPSNQLPIFLKIALFNEERSNVN